MLEKTYPRIRSSSVARQVSIVVPQNIAFLDLRLEG
jgi:hypothetical protein